MSIKLVKRSNLTKIINSKTRTKSLTRIAIKKTTISTSVLTL